MRSTAGLKSRPPGTAAAPASAMAVVPTGVAAPVAGSMTYVVMAEFAAEPVVTATPYSLRSNGRTSMPPERLPRAEPRHGQRSGDRGGRRRVERHERVRRHERAGAVGGGRRRDGEPPSGS